MNVKLFDNHLRAYFSEDISKRSLQLILVAVAETCSKLAVFTLQHLRPSRDNVTADVMKTSWCSLQRCEQGIVTTAMRPTKISTKIKCLFPLQFSEPGTSESVELGTIDS